MALPGYPAESPVPALAAGSGRIAPLPQRLAERVPPGRRPGIPSPFRAGLLVGAIWRHPVDDDDSEHAFLRDLVVRACDGLAGAFGR